MSSDRKIVEDTRQKFNEGLKSIYNVKVSQGLDDATLRKELRRNLEFAGHSIENPTIFANGNVLPTDTKSLPLKKIWDLFGDARLKKLKTGEFFLEKIVPTLARPVRERYELDVAFDAIGFGYYIGKTTAYGVGCATTVSTLNPLSLPVCFKFFTSISETQEQYEKLQGSRARNRANQVSNLQSAVSELSQHLSVKYSNTVDWKFDVISNPLKLDNSSVNVRSIVGSSNNSQLDNLIVDRLTKDTVFPNLEEMNSYFSKYQDGLGDMFRESVQRTIETETQLDQKKQIEQQERNLLYNSLGQLAGVFANQVMGPNEAKLFNALLPVGMQLAVGAAMGPMGWAALGMSVASTLMSSSKADPNVAIFKALAQIQKQLNVIIKGIEQIQKTQIEILKGIDEILQSVQELKEIQIAGINRILTELSDLAVTIDVSQLQEFNDGVKDNFQKIYYIVAKENVSGNADLTRKELKDAFDWLVSAAQLKLNNRLFTRFDEKIESVDASKFKKEILGSRFSNPVSLYDTIGLISGLKDYSVREDNLKVRNTKPISHPQSFYKMTGEIIDWLVMSKDEVDIGRKKEFCERLLTTAESSKKNINETCDNPTVERKITDYSQTMEKTLVELHKYLKNQHYQDFERHKFELKNQGNYRGLCRLNSVGKNFIEGNDTKLPFDYSIVSSKDDDFSNFLNAKNKWDDPWLNFLSDLGIITDVKRVTQTKIKHKHDGSSKPNSIKTGYVMGSKTNEIVFNSTIISKNPIQFSFNYVSKLIATIIKDKEESRSSSGSGSGSGGHDWTVYVPKIKAAKAETSLESIDWKPTIKNLLGNKEDKFDSLFPDQNSLNFYGFLNLLVEKWFKDKKMEFVTEGFKTEFFTEGTKEGKSYHDKIDGCGISLMVLSKLNQVVTSDYLVPYDVDYGDEIFTQEDFRSALEYYATRNYEEYNIYNELTKEKDKNLFQEILKEYEEVKKQEPQNKKESIFFLKGETETPLNPNLFVDLMCILMKRRTLNTVINCRSKIRDIKENDCEPYLADTINVLKLFRDEYLHLPAEVS